MAVLKWNDALAALWPWRTAVSRARGAAPRGRDRGTVSSLERSRARSGASAFRRFRESSLAPDARAGETGAINEVLRLLQFHLLLNVVFVPRSSNEVQPPPDAATFDVVLEGGRLAGWLHCLPAAHALPLTAREMKQLRYAARLVGRTIDQQEVMRQLARRQDDATLPLNRLRA